MDGYDLAATLRVRYAETDAMGIVYHANYLTWFEIARTELCRSWGKPYAYWEEAGIALPVAESYCKYRCPARYDDIIEIHCRVKELKLCSITFCYRVIRQNDGRLIADGWTKHAFADKTGKLLKRRHEFYGWIQEKLTVYDESEK